MTETRGFYSARAHVEYRLVLGAGEYVNFASESEVLPGSTHE